MGENQGAHGSFDFEPGYKRLKCKITSDPKPEMLVPLMGYGNNPLRLKMKGSSMLEGEREVRSYGYLNTNRIMLSRVDTTRTH